MATTTKTTTAKPKAAAPKTAAAKAPAKTAKQTQAGPAVTVTQVKSSAGRIKSQQDTLVGLGLGRIGKSKTLQATPSVQGMINKVAHLIEVKQSA